MIRKGERAYEKEGEKEKKEEVIIEGEGVNEKRAEKEVGKRRGGKRKR